MEQMIQTLLEHKTYDTFWIKHSHNINDSNYFEADTHTYFSGSFD